MNKEELKKEVKTLGMKYGDSYDSYTKSGSQAEAAIRDTLKLIDQLDEPEKIVVPQFVADWIGRMKTKNYTLRGVFGYINDPMDYKEDIEISKWVGGSHKRNDDIARAWLYGYEVEKQKLFHMPLPYQSNTTIYYYKRDDGKISYKQGGMMYENCKFTQEEIDEYFPEIKHMAIEVSS